MVLPEILAKGNMEYQLQEIKSFVVKDTASGEEEITSNPGSTRMLVWLCYKFLRCVIGNKLYHQRSCGLDLDLTKIGTSSDIAFMLLLLEYNYEPWKRQFETGRSSDGSDDSISSDGDSTVTARGTNKKRKDDFIYLCRKEPQERYYDLQLAALHLKEQRSDELNRAYREYVAKVEANNTVQPEKRARLTKDGERARKKRVRCTWGEIITDFAAI